MTVKGILKSIAILLVGGLLGIYLKDHVTLGKKTSSGSSERKILYWVAPMDANYRRDKPGKSPMGMDLVPVYADGAGANDDCGITISPTVQNNIALKTAKVKIESLSKKIDTVGYVKFDENGIKKINNFVDGWIKHLNVHSNGEIVKKDQLLFELYSPTLINAEQEYLLAIKNNTALVKASEKKLKTLGMSDKQIYFLRQSKKVVETLKVYAPQSGLISHLKVREGMYVKPDKTLFMITDLSSVWVDAQVYENEAALISIGQEGIASFTAYPNKKWLGSLFFIDNQLDPKSRTLNVRLSFPNPDLSLKPNMLANIKIVLTPVNNTLVIPSSAVIYNDGMQRVIVADDNNKFYAQEVKTGIEVDHKIEIQQGLEKGQSVVVNGQFLIDSESSVQQSMVRLNAKSEDTTVEVYGTGKVVSIDNEKRTLTIDHAPIPKINMPSMKMRLHVLVDVSLDGIEINQQVNFILIKNDDGEYVICYIESRGNDDK